MVSKRSGPVAALMRLRSWGLALGALALTALILLAELWDNPPHWLRPVHMHVAWLLHWARQHWLSAAAVGTLASVISAVIAFQSLQLARNQTASRNQNGDSARHRALMIKRVANKWIDGLLAQSLEGAALLALGLARRTDLIDLAAVARRLPNGRYLPLPAADDVGEIFEQLGGGMLIIGEPGSGKTTLLLQLAGYLLAQASDDSSLPIPVVFNLASWSLHRKPVAEWMIDELLVSYKIPASIANSWIAEDALTPLLDGLDEVGDSHRSALVAAINSFYRDRSIPVVVCCRTRELENTACKLALEDAIELRPPTDEQIETYLRHIERTGTSLTGIRTSFRSDPALYKLLHSPLMLHVIALAYHGLPGPAMMSQMSFEEQQARLWDAYIDRMFAQRPIPSRSGYSEYEARWWIYWLARMLKEQEQIELQLDRLAPSWLPVPWPGRVRRLAGLVTGLITGLAGCFAFGLTFGWDVGIWIGIAVGILLGIDAGLSGTPRWRDFPLVEQMRWSWRRMLVGLLVGLVAGTLGGLLVSLVHGFYGGLGFALAGGLGGGLIGGVTSTLRDERVVPNEGIRRSARHALRFGVTAGLAACLIGALTSVREIGFITGMGIGVAGAMAGGLAIGLVVNTHTGIAAVLSHYAVRASLVHLQRAPWRYVRFLDEMRQRLILRQSGSAYRFAHRLLQDHISTSNIYND